MEWGPACGARKKVKRLRGCGRAWQFLKRWDMESPSDPATWPQGWTHEKRGIDSTPCAVLTAALAGPPRSGENPMPIREATGTHERPGPRHGRSLSRKRSGALARGPAWTDLRPEAERREPDTSGHTACDSTYVTCPEQANPQTESRGVVARGWGRHGARPPMGTGLLWVMECSGFS